MPVSKIFLHLCLYFHISCLSFSCARHPLKLYEPVVRSTYTYVLMDDGRYVVLSKNPEDVKKVIDEVKCKPCRVDWNGQVWIISRVK